jgi:hypothetical protein
MYSVTVSGVKTHKAVLKGVRDLAGERWLMRIRGRN